MIIDIILTILCVAGIVFSARAIYFISDDLIDDVEELKEYLKNKSN